MTYLLPRLDAWKHVKDIIEETGMTGAALREFIEAEKSPVWLKHKKVVAVSSDLIAAIRERVFVSPPLSWVSHQTLILAATKHQKNLADTLSEYQINQFERRICEVPHSQEFSLDVFYPLMSARK